MHIPAVPLLAPSLLTTHLPAPVQATPLRAVALLVIQSSVFQLLASGCPIAGRCAACRPDAGRNASGHMLGPRVDGRVAAGCPAACSVAGHCATGSAADAVEVYTRPDVLTIDDARDDVARGRQEVEGG